MAPASGQADGEAAPIFVTEIPPGYRDWRLISVAHEEGDLNDLRTILGNDVAINAYREGKLPFPDGTIIARLAWSYDPISSRSSSRPAGRREKAVCIAYPQSCGESEQHKVSGHAIDRRTNVCDRAVKQVSSAGPSRGC